MAHSDCTEGGQGTGAGPGAGSTVHIAVGPGLGRGPENIMRVCLHVLETALFQQCAREFDHLTIDITSLIAN